ncbi:hypothetical protein EOM57_05780, partial [Candidatus Saccharibacteria bacterium]|nr:hypothetical protein [Candidatus Saccharibacteria bacterium]
DEVYEVYDNEGTKDIHKVYDLDEYLIGTILIVKPSTGVAYKVYEVYDNSGTLDTRQVYGDFRNLRSPTLSSRASIVSTVSEVGVLYLVYIDIDDDTDFRGSCLAFRNYDNDSINVISGVRVVSISTSLPYATTTKSATTAELSAEITKITDGTTIAKKAEQDSDGLVIKSNYVVAHTFIYNQDTNKLEIKLFASDGTLLDTKYITLLKATSTKDGLMPKEDKVKLDALPTNAELGNLLDDKADQATTYTKTECDNAFIENTEKGSANGVAPLGADSKIPSIYLQGFVDDVIEIETAVIYRSTNPIPNGTGGSALPRRNLYINGSAKIEIWVKPIPDTVFVYERDAITDAIYLARDTSKIYRLTGVVSGTLAEISASLALGETSSTAYRGDRGKTAYDHSQLTSGNPHGTTKSDVGLGNADNTADVDKVNMISITYADLVDLRDDGELVAGKFYRITDYVTTSEQANTQSAMNVFDVIVRADSASSLNENA